MEVHQFLIYILAYIGFFATSFYILSTFFFSKPDIREELTDKTVSIIIPAYNEEKSIARTIDSALRLDYPKDKFEIIVVNDGSKDNTYEIAKKYESFQNPVVRVFTKKNGGKASALNLGIANSNKEIIISMDADSFVREDALKKMIAYFYNDSVVSVTPSMGVYSPHGFLQRVQQIEYYMGVFLRKSFSSVNAVHITPGAFSAYRREFFLKYGGYDEKNITEDLEIALRIQSQDYIIANASKAVVYTIAPSTFRSLMVQRRRWYTGLIKNLWDYRRLFGFQKGPLGFLVLPVAASTVLLSVIITIYTMIKTLNEIRIELVSFSAINFSFRNFFDINYYTLQIFFYRVFSQPLFLFSFFFITLLLFYLYFSKKEMRYKDSIRLGFFFFVISYSLLFAFWWALSFIYIIFNRKVVWREE